MEGTNSPITLTAEAIALEKRVQKLETNWTITLIVAGILGLSGAYIGNHLSEIKKEVEGLRGQISTQKKEMEVLSRQISDASQFLTNAKAVTIADIAEREALAVRKLSGVTALSEAKLAAFLDKKRESAIVSFEAIIREERQRNEDANIDQNYYLRDIYSSAYLSHVEKQISPGSSPGDEFVKQLLVNYKSSRNLKYIRGTK